MWTRAAPAAWAVCLLLAAPASCQAGAPSGVDAPRLDDLLLDRPAATRAAAFRALTARRDPRDLAPLGDLLRFNRDPDEWFVLLDALQPFFEVDLRQQSGVWGLVTRETARRIHAEPTLPAWPGYAAWKAALLGMAVDPRMRGFFERADGAAIRVEEVVWGGVEVDGIPSLDDAPRARAAEVDFLDDDEAVFGLAWDGAALAFPLRVLDWHEMANDELAGVPFALAYCTLCGAAVAYSTARAAGEPPFRFGSSGLLMRSNKLMFDRGTHTLWNQLTGVPVMGALVESGVELDVLPVVATTWGRWKAAHPQTETVTLATGHDRRYEPGAAYGGYFADAGVMFPAVGPRAAKSAAESAAAPADKEQLYVVRTPGAAPTAFRVADVEGAPGGLLRVRHAGRPVLLVGAPRRPVPLPAVWRDALGDASPDDTAPDDTVPEHTGPEHTAPEHVGDLDGPAAVALLRSRACFDALTAERLLAMRPTTRFAVLAAYAPDPDGAEPRLPRALRDAVAVRALAAPVRAYALEEVGDETAFTRVSVDAIRAGEDGPLWRIEEQALRAVGRDDLPRLPGHLVFGLGWRAYWGGPPAGPRPEPR